MMGMVIDVGAQTRADVVAPVELLQNELRSDGQGAERLLVLTDARVAGHYTEFRGSKEELLHQFEVTDMLGFFIGVGVGRFISVYPPRSFNSKLAVWRIIAETNQHWDKVLLDNIIEFSGINYAIISQDEALDLDPFDRLNRDNFPWDHWQLIAAKLKS
jgi:hypothetical protein